MYDIDRINRLAKNYGYGDGALTPGDDLHTALDNFDHWAGIDTSGGIIPHNKFVRAYHYSPLYNYVGARITLHERHAGFTQPDPARSYFWLGAEAETA
jgi:hypothetical protein